MQRHIHSDDSGPSKAIKEGSRHEPPHQRCLPAVVMVVSALRDKSPSCSTTFTTRHSHIPPRRRERARAASPWSINCTPYPQSRVPAFCENSLKLVVCVVTAPRAGGPHSRVSPRGLRDGSVAARRRRVRAPTPVSRWHRVVRRRPAQIGSDESTTAAHLKDGFSFVKARLQPY